MKSKPLPLQRSQEGRERDLSVPAHEDDAVTTATNPAYEMVKQAGGGGGGGEQESYKIEVSLRNDPKAADKTYEMPSHPSCQPLPTIPGPLFVAPPTGGDVGMTRKGKEEGANYNIPGDQ